MDEDDEITEMLSYIFNDTKITVLSISENGGDVKDVINILKKKGMVTNEGIAWQIHYTKHHNLDMFLNYVDY